MSKKQSADAKNQEDESDSDSLETTILETNNMESATGVAATVPANLSGEQLAALLASIGTLAQSVELLRQETSAEIQQLRAHVTSTETFINGQSSPPPTVAPQQTSVQPPLQVPSTIQLPLQVPSQQTFAQPPLQVPSHHAFVQLPRQITPLHTYSQPPMLPPLTSTPLPYQTNPPTMPYNGVVSLVDNSTAKLYPLPPFDGNPEDWPLFLANFRDTTTEFGYNNRQNLMRLHKALHGNAKRAVTSLLIYPDDVPQVMEELEFNFGRPDLLIRSQLQKVQQFPCIFENRLENVLDFSNRVRNIVAFFKSAKCEHHLLNPILLEQLITKLPPSKQYEWSRHAASILPYPTVESFATWISDLAKVVALMPSVATTSWRSSLPTQVRVQPTPQHHANRQTAQVPSGSRRVLHSAEAPMGQQSQRKQNACLQCGQSHDLVACREFQSLKTNAKWDLIKRRRLCFACLKEGHSLTMCTDKKECGIHGCRRYHHELLHADRNPSSQSSPTTKDETERVFSCRQQHQSHLFKILPVTLCGPNGVLFAYAMLDEGSSVSLLDANIATELGLKGSTMPLTLQWYGEKKTTENCRKVALTICGDTNEFAIKNIYTVERLNLPSQSLQKDQHEHLKGLPIADYTNATPVILLGLDNSFLSATSEVVQCGTEKPIAAKTKLGWVVYGPHHEEIAAEPRVLHIQEARTLKQLNAIVEDYFSVENFGVRSTNVILESDVDKRARKLLTETVKDIGCRYEVGLLWREDNVELPTSYAMAKQRLLNMENKMTKNPTFAIAYRAQIEQFIEKGYARPLEINEQEMEGPTTWYLPHFGVVNPHKPQKLRIVFDAAATASGVSLNSVLMKGPDHAQPLLAILHKFRQGHIAVVGDIKEMFLQVKIRADDQRAQRFLWRNGNPSEPIQSYVMTSMLFGAACSPCCAEYIKNFNASKYVSSMPRGAKAVVEKMYVDDLVLSVDTVEEAEAVAHEAIKINAGAGFTLRNFVSNCKALQQRLNENNDVQGDTVNMEYQPSTDKVLGLYWNSKADTFEFQFKFFKIDKDVLQSKRPPTKREMLGIVMAIYDPFGFLANVTIFTKLLVQATWKHQVQWDEALPQHLQNQWFAWWREFQSVKEIAIPRYYSRMLPSADDVQLHIFVDASSSAYAAVAYLRIRKCNEADVVFVTAKTRCAPTKGMTVPRLELQAAVLGNRLRTSIEECHEFQISSTIYWSDSKTVLLWIRSTTREYKQFVAFRIAEILATSDPVQWRWVPTSLNVADEATRAKLLCDVDSNSRWLAGPEFLRQDEEHWPQEPSPFLSEHCKVEEKRTLLLLKPGGFCVNYTKYSCYFKMLRIIAWVRRFTMNARSDMRVKGELTGAEICDAGKLICRQVQEDAYSIEVSSLRAHGNVHKSSCLYPLTPFLDTDGLLKIKGRIDAAYCLPVAARRPIIMPQHHRVTAMIMEYYHKKRRHQNDNLIINEVRQEFWIPRARALLNSIKRTCPVCIQARAQPIAPLMGQLPIDRLTPYVRAFSYTGVDYCGPFNVAIGRRREKRWVALFTCMTTRAVHLEVAEDLSTDSFLICFRNFVNRRGIPTRMRSDNGTNFIGAQKELKREDRLFDFDRIEQEMARENIEWLFNCPANPSAGGCWERLVMCVKRVLQKVLQEEAPRLETFRSVLIEAENIVNSRPLTELPLTHEDDEPLTPNHFLNGCLNSTQTPSPEAEKLCLRKQWKIAQNLKDRMWKRWTVEYLPQLLQRSKWRDEVPPLKPDQLVLICDSSLPRSQWEKGRIIRVFTAKDGQVRTAEVKTKHGVLRRPACKLAALTFVNPDEGSTGGGMSV